MEVGAWAGSRLLQYVSGSALQVFLGVFLLISSVKMMLKHPGKDRDQMEEVRQPLPK
jgi:uncharacterized membrane protein YfcA